MVSDVTPLLEVEAQLAEAKALMVRDVSFAEAKALMLRDVLLMAGKLNGQRLPWRSIVRMSCMCVCVFEGADVVSLHRVVFHPSAVMALPSARVLAYGSCIRFLHTVHTVLAYLVQ